MQKCDKFRYWLQNELDKRHWDQVELTRGKRITRAHVSRILSGERQPGPEAARAIADALGLPHEVVFRHAGLLTPEKKTEAISGADELLHYYAELTPEDRTRLIDIARTFAQAHRRPRMSRRSDP